VIPARNEKDNIVHTLDALNNQTLPPNKVIVVDDGSEDNTLEILNEYEAQNYRLIIRSREKRRGGKSLVGTPAIATTFNVGFKVAEKFEFDYLMVLGADTILDKNYIEKLIIEFTRDKSLAIASGQSKQMEINPTHARGSGRIFNSKFWKYYGGKYPEIYGWEDDCLIQCQRLGLNVRSFKHIRFSSTRRDQGTIDFINWGRATRSMKYNPILVLMRATRLLLLQNYGIKAFLRFLAGYLSSPVSEKLEPAQIKNREFLWKHQLLQIPEKIGNILKIK
jgi:glycosyltransferase involved in cell wall biosynthesis